MQFVSRVFGTKSTTGEAILHLAPGTPMRDVLGILKLLVLSIITSGCLTIRTQRSVLPT